MGNTLKAKEDSINNEQMCKCADVQIETANLHICTFAYLYINVMAEISIPYW
jgi:hypothetical protein